MIRISRGRDLLAFALLYAQLAFAFWIVPRGALAGLLAPTGIALVGAVATTLGITLLRLAGRGGSLAERWLLAAFLAGMPFIYVLSWLQAPQAGWLPIELGGVVIFGALAVAGVRGSAWWLALGIAAHGVAWDLWHHGRTTFIADWYTIACLVSDLGIGGYIALQVSRFAR